MNKELFYLLFNGGSLTLAAGAGPTFVGLGVVLPNTTGIKKSMTGGICDAATSK